MRVSEYVAKTLADLGARHVFMLTGGAAMFLNDAFGHEPRLRCIFNHHEQASAMAAEGYARISGIPGVVNVTAGPGGINALNGVFGVWVDSIPMLVVSGQVKRETLVATHDIPGLRQIGDQEADIIRMVKGITKYAVLVTEPESIGYHLGKAWYLASTGRPGPCWLDIPIDVQAAEIDPETLPTFQTPEGPETAPKDLAEICRDVSRRIQQARRPVILVGKGVRLSKAEAVFDRVIAKLNIPVVAAWTGIDLIPHGHPLYCGLSADVGTRAGNFAVQNADVLLVIGSRLSLRQVTYNWKTFARHAYKIHVEIDRLEMLKPTVNIDLPVAADARVFLETLEFCLKQDNCLPVHHEWLAWCKERVARYPVVQPHHSQVRHNRLNPYGFMDRLWGLLKPTDIVVCGNGTANVVTFQTARMCAGQRLFCNTGNASMGYDLPAAIGAAIAAPERRVLCFAGDGSVQLNIQELQSLKHLQPNLILFVLNNQGYLSIRLSQKHFFNRLTGESPESGLTFPDIIKLARAYDLEAARLDASNAPEMLEKVLASRGPLVCEVLLDPDQTFEPKVSSRQLPDGRIVSAPLEDMAPFLSREELSDNLFIPPLEF